MVSGLRSKLNNIFLLPISIHRDSTYSDASGTVDMITSAKTKLATYVGIKKSGDSPGGSFSLKITKLLKQSKLNLAQFIDGKSVCSQYSRNNFNNLTNMMVNVPTVDGSYKIINAATYLLFQEGNGHPLPLETINIFVSFTAPCIFITTRSSIVHAYTWPICLLICSCAYSSM